MQRNGFRLKRALKIAVAHALYSVGLLQLWLRRISRQSAIVLMYHRVLTTSEWQATGSHPAMSVTAETFAQHMAILRQRFVPLTLGEFGARMRNRQPFPDRACLITFDDGWRDTLTNALPLLREQQLPSAVFVPVNFIGSRRLFTRETFAHLVMLARDLARRQPERAPAIRALLARVELDRLLDLSGPDVRAAVIESAGAAPMTPAFDELVQALAGVLDVRVEQLETPDAFMDWDQVQGLARHGVEIGGHGAEHRRLALLSPEAADADIRTCAEVLARRTSPMVRSFSYPNGSYNETVIQMVRNHGYELAFTTRGGVVRCDDDPLQIRRINIQEDMTQSLPMFLARLAGLF